MLPHPALRGAFCFSAAGCFSLLGSCPPLLLFMWSCAWLWWMDLIWNPAYQIKPQTWQPKDLTAVHACTDFYYLFLTKMSRAVTEKRRSWLQELWKAENCLEHKKLLNFPFWIGQEKLQPSRVLLELLLHHWLPFPGRKNWLYRVFLVIPLAFSVIQLSCFSKWWIADAPNI